MLDVLRRGGQLRGKARLKAVALDREVIHGDMKWQNTQEKN